MTSKDSPFRFIFLFLIGVATLSAQTWQQRALERFAKPMTDAERALIDESIPDAPRATPKAPRRILVISRCEGFIHLSIPYGKYMLETMGEKTGAFTVDFVDEYDAFTAENLARYDAILFNNTTNLTPTEEQCVAIMDFVEGGKGIVGIHAATDNFKQWHEGICMMGGVFDGHPWRANGNWAFRLDDAEHPVNHAFEGAGFWHTDEIYQYKPESFQGPDNLRILVSLDMTKEHNQQPLAGDLESDARENALRAAAGREVAVSWIRTLGKGRLFYTNFGHREDTNWNPRINRHILDGIQFALGDLEADATPTAEVKDLVVAPAPEKP